MDHAAGMKPRVHPKYKTKYRVSNWTEYDQALVQRGDITLWLSEGRKRSFRVIASWKPAPTGLRGAQKKFSDHAIETALTLRTVFNVAENLTHGSTDDARTALDLIDEIEGDIVSITADAAYDTIAIYDAAAARGVRVVVPPIKTATRSRRRSPLPCARDRTIMRVKEIGRRRWKKESGYHLLQIQIDHWPQTACSTSEVTGELWPIRPQRVEASIACIILNLMTEIGRPESISIGA
jgi:hypothetical protein